MTENYEKIKKREKKDDGSYLLQSYWTAADAVEFDDGQTLDIKIETFVTDTYDALDNMNININSRMDDFESDTNDRLDSFESDMNDKLDNTKTDLENEISDLDTKTSDEDTRLQGEIDDINTRIDDFGGEVQTDLSTLETTCKEYSDKLIEDLVGQAPSALDTIYELAEAMEKEKDVTDVLNSAIITKVDKSSITTTISDTSDDTQVPGALTVYNALNDMNTNIKKQLESYSATEPTDGTNYWLELY